MTETEIKSIIDESLYNRVLAAFKWDGVKEQVNHYYTDENGLLRKKRIMVRVRTADGTSIIQVKLRRNADSPIQICDESSYEIHGVPDTLDAEMTKKITGIDAGPLRRIGSASTLRHSFHRGGSELCLDKTTYFGKTDYETEIEYTEKVCEEILMKLTRLGVSFKGGCVGKFSRFLAEYEKNNARNI